MKRLIQQHDIEAFNTCPLIFHKFTYNKKSLPSKLYALLKSAVAVFSRMMIDKNLDHRQALFAAIGEVLKNDEKYKDRKIHNLAIIGIVDFINKTKELFDSKKIQVIATNYEFYHTNSFGTFKGKIPAILSDGIEVIPVFYSFPDVHINKDNYIRFLSAAIALKGIKVRQFGVLHATEHYTLKFSLENFREGELERAAKELDDVIQLLTSGYATPNTNHCKSCEFFNKCKL